MKVGASDEQSTEELDRSSNHRRRWGWPRSAPTLSLGQRVL